MISNVGKPRSSENSFHAQLATPIAEYQNHEWGGTSPARRQTSYRLRSRQTEFSAVSFLLSVDTVGIVLLIPGLEWCDNDDEQCSRTGVIHRLHSAYGRKPVTRRIVRRFCTSKPISFVSRMLYSSFSHSATRRTKQNITSCFSLATFTLFH